MCVAVPAPRGPRVKASAALSRGIELGRLLVGRAVGGERSRPLPLPDPPEGERGGGAGGTGPTTGRAGETCGDAEPFPGVCSFPTGRSPECGAADGALARERGSPDWHVLPTLGRAWPGPRRPGPPCAFEMSMIKEFCNSH